MFCIKNSCFSRVNTTQNISDHDRRFVADCPVGCTTGLADSEIVLPDGPLRRCTSCGHLVSSCSENRYWSTMKEFNAPQGTWPSAKGIKRLVRRVHRMLIKCEELLRKRRGNIHLIDVGCSSGALVYAAKSLGVHAEGVEPSPYPVQTAMEHGLKVYRGFLEDQRLPGESYDVITLLEVVEHLRAPLQLFQECHRILSPGGIVIVKTGNTDSWTARFMRGRWEYFDIARHGGHISFFNPLSIELLAQRCGFKVIQIKTRKLNFYEKETLPFVVYRTSRFFANILRHPAAWLGKGHEMLACLQKLL